MGCGVWGVGVGVHRGVQGGRRGHVRARRAQERALCAFWAVRSNGAPGFGVWAVRLGSRVYC